MDDIAKAMRVIRLRDEYNRYLTAGYDQVSVILTKPKNVGHSLENTKWRVEWVKSPKDLVGQVRLLSVYNKALTFAHDPADYYYKDELGNALTQQPWPPSLGGEAAAASEWELELKKRKDDNDVSHQIGFLSKWSKRYGTNLSLNTIVNEYKFRFESFQTSKLFKWLNQYWFFELVQVKNRDNYNGCSTTSTVNEKVININSPTTSTSTSTSTSRIGSTINFKVDTSHDESQKGLNPKTSTPPEEQRLMRINHGVKVNNNVGDSSLDQFMMNMFSRCQIDQLYLNMSSTSTRFHTGYKHPQYINTGGNVNGSGDQDNGDVNLSTQINRSRDNEVEIPF